MSPVPPRRLGRYEVAEVIGTGAFATVYRARDERLDTDVAVKVLAENHSFDPDVRERFLSEGHLLRRVDSPQVVTVFDLGETEAGQPYLVLELATGGDLAARRRSLGDRSPGLPDVLLVARQLAAALGALHARQVVHRDVAPGNLLIRGGPPAAPPTSLLAPGERLLLADLGLSKDLAARSGLTVGAGTAGFTPPEQGEGGWVDARADIWSASALLVWLALGAGPDADARWDRALLRLGWPAAVVRELARGLSTRPEDRHDTAEAWVDALDAAARPLVAEPDAARSAPSARRGRRVVLALLLAVLLAGGAGWLAGRSSVGDRFGTSSTEILGGRKVRVGVQDGPVRVEITGPATVAVGDAATYAAGTAGVAHTVWLAPDGRSYSDEPTILVRPTAPGLATVRLVGQTADGDISIAELEVTVVEEP